MHCYQSSPKSFSLKPNNQSTIREGFCFNFSESLFITLLTGLLHTTEIILLLVNWEAQAASGRIILDFISK